MQSRALLNIALFIFVALLATYIYINNQQQQQTSVSEQLTQLSADEVTKINIRHNQRHIELKKQNGKWRMLQPIKIDANSFRIETILKMLNTVSHADYAATDLDEDKYGLAQASTSISFNDTRIDFGIVNPINNYRYVRVGDSVHLIDDYFYPLLSSQTGTLVARELISSDASIDKLELPEHTLYRDENNNWRSSNEVGPDAINETLHHWQHGQAFGVHNYMPRDSLAEISVYLDGEPETVRFYITDTDPWLIIARPELDIEYHFNLEFHDRLLRPGADGEKPEDLDE